MAASPTAGRTGTASALVSVTAASVLSRGFALIRGVVTARLLPPELYGTATLVSALNGYAQYADLGSSSVAFRELTAAVGTGTDVEVKSRWLFTFKITSMLAAAVVSLVAAGLTRDAGIRTALLAFPVIGLAAALFWVLLVQAQARGRMHEFSRATALSSIADLVLGIGGTYLFGLPGLLAAFALSPAIAGAWLLSRGHFSGPGRVPAAAVRSYVWTGLPLVVLGFLDHNLVYVDHLVVLGFFGVRELGIYNVALIASDAVRVIGTAVGAVIGPRLIQDHARSGSVQAIREHTLLPVHLLACVTPFAIAVVWLGAGYAVPRLYPAYVETLPALRILLIATYLLVCTGGVTTFLFALNKHRRNLLILTPVLALNVVVDVVLVKAGLGIEGVALGSGITYLVYAIVHLWYVARHFGPTAGEWTRFYLGVFVPGAWTAAVLLTIDATVASSTSAPHALAAIVLAVLALAPLGLRGWRLVRRLDAMA
jgi:O-antigen/teichoic acid export membrane protein